MLTSESKVSELNGVGATRTKQLEKLGIETVSDLIYCFPRSYEHRGDVRALLPFYNETSAAYILTVASEVKSAKLRANLTVSKFRAFDDSGSCEIVFFNSPYIKDTFHIGSRFRFFGKLTVQKSKLSITNPKFEPYIDGIPLPDFTPIYHLTEGLSGKTVEKLISNALKAVLPQLEDPLPEKIRLENSLPTLTYALKNIHLPESDEALRKSIKRLAFDELLYFGLGVSLSNKYKTSVKGVHFEPCDMKEFTEKLSYELTGGQKQAINDIYYDTVIKTKKEAFGHMARILVGDVGCGKTVCAAAAIYIAAKSGFQSALMAPTEILARQHFQDMSKLFSSIGINCELLVGSTTPKEKKRIYGAIKDRSATLVIGTHALLSEKVEFSKLGLVITDEQHRFGVAQRAILNDKDSAAHMLVMSATPIPRTLALTMYGDLDVSRITEMPNGRQRVDTFVINEEYRARLNDFINKQVLLGGQCYIVCPAIEKKDDESPDAIAIENFGAKQRDLFSNIKNVDEYADILRQKLPNLKIDVLHGKKKGKEKDEIMRKFSEGETDVLVSTTVIEVGVNVPNASLMIIENADRYGLSQLHQLRGRVGRGSRKSYCILVSDLNTPKAKERLEVMRTTYDGFEIANRDLEMRGPGDFFSSGSSETLRQSGGFDFKLASLCDDNSLPDIAFALAKSIIKSDPELIFEEHMGLKKEIMKHIKPIASSIS